MGTGLAARPWSTGASDARGLAVVAGGERASSAATPVPVDTTAPVAPTTTAAAIVATTAPAPGSDPVVVAARRRPRPGETTTSPATTRPAPTTTTTMPPEPEPTTTSTPPVSLSEPPSLRGSIVYSSDERGDEDIWVMDPDGGHRRRLLPLPGIDLYPDLSPDGRRIVWSHFDRAYTPNGWNIVIADSDGGKLRTLVAAPGSAQVPKFSPDGTRILFRAPADGSGSYGAPTSFFTMAADGSDIREVPGAAQLRPWTADWAGDGRHVLIDATATDGPPGSLWLLDLADGTRRRIGNGGGATPSPDGTHIVYAGQHGIWITGPDGADPRLVADGNMCGDPSWAPDGQLIAFGCVNDGPYGDFDVWVARPDGTGVRNITAMPGYQERSPTF